MKIKTSQISIKSDNFDERLSRLKDYEGFQNLEILDQPNTNKFKIMVPVSYRFRGGYICFKIQCVILIKKEKETIEIEVYSDFLKPFIIALIIGIGIGALTYLVQASLSFSLVMLFVAIFLTGGVLFNQIIKQTQSKKKKRLDQIST